MCKESDVQKLRAHLQKLEMPVFETLDGEITQDPDQLFDYMMQDKKNKNDDMTLILAREIGNSYIEHKADQASVKNYLHRICNEAKT